MTYLERLRIDDSLRSLVANGVIVPDNKLIDEDIRGTVDMGVVVRGVPDRDAPGDRLDRLVICTGGRCVRGGAGLGGVYVWGEEEGRTLVISRTITIVMLLPAA